MIFVRYLLILIRRVFDLSDGSTARGHN